MTESPEPHGEVEQVPPPDSPGGFAPSPVAPLQGTGFLAQLACVHSCPEGSFADIYLHLGSTLSLLEKQAFILKSGQLDNDTAAYMGPFIARGILEATLTALIGRIDPFRLLMVREKQLLSDYDYSEKSAIALNWNSDFNSDKRNGGEIDLDTRIETLPRSLFGKYYEKALWIEAFERFADVEKDARTDWLIEMSKVEAKQFLPNMRQEVQRLYSRCSKAIHQEFVVKNADYSDHRFVLEQIGRSIELTAKLCIVFNCSPHVLHPAGKSDAFGWFQSLNESWQA